MKWHLWVFLPVVAAFIGWITNYIAVRMIFRPRRPIRVLGFSFQGLLPKRRSEFAESIGATIEEHLVSPQDVKEVLEDPAVAAKIRESVASKVEHFLEHRLVAGMPMLGAFMKGPIVEKMKQGIVEELGDGLSSVVDTLGDHLDEHLDFRGMVTEKIEGFDMGKLEDIVLAVASKELRAIEFLGALLGFAVGWIQLLALQWLA